MSSTRTISVRMKNTHQMMLEDHSSDLEKAKSILQKISHDIGLGISSAIKQYTISSLLCTFELILVSLLKLSNTPIQRNIERVAQNIRKATLLTLLADVIYEELIFRGILRPSIKGVLEIATGNSNIAKYGSSIISSGLFASAHTYGSMFSRFFNALTYDSLKDESGSLIAPIAAHAALNAIVLCT